MKTSKINLRKKTGDLQQKRTGVKRRLLVETLCERRVLATITGMVFDDANDSWRVDAQEATLADRLVFADRNDNRLPDDGEPFALTDIDGSFSLEQLGSDDQIIRLFSGAASEQQQFPVHPQADTEIISLGDFETAASTGNLRIDPFGDRAVVQVADGLMITDLLARTTVEVQLGARPVASEFLADGRILVLATDQEGNHAFLVDPQGTIQVADLLLPPGDAGGESLDDFSGWASVAIDSDGNGILIPKAEADSVLARELLIAGQSVSSVATTTSLSPTASLIGGGSLTTVLAQSSTDGLALALWSNSTGTLISDQPVMLAGVDSVVAYSDASGLTFALSPSQSETSIGSLLVLDAAADFAALQTITDLDDLIAVDTDRSVVFSLSTEQSRLRAIDAVTAETVADWMIDIDLIGEPMEMVVHAAGKELVLLGSAGLATVSLDRTDAHRVTLDGSIPQYPLRFAVNVAGDNEAPVFLKPLEFRVVQGDPLVVPAGGLLTATSDPEADPFVIVRTTSPNHGLASVTPQGGMTYTADPDFAGDDSFEVFLHDGRGASAVLTVQVTVSPFVAPDPALSVTVFPVPENAEPGFVVGEIETIGFGAPPLFVIDDPRFQVVDGLIIVVDGAVLDYEQEYLITSEITATDADTEQSLTQSFTVQLSDEDDPIEDILPRSASIYENVAGELIAELMVIDEDAEQPFFLTVDDDRFEIINRNLRLKPGVSLNYEASSEVLINLTATDALGGGNSLTVPFTITVTDVAEQASSIALSNAAVLELVAGADVGELIVDGQPLRANYRASVDDTRFEIVDGVLKLRDDEFLSFSDQQEAQVIITVEDIGRVFSGTSETFVIAVLENENPFYNPDSPFDVNSDGQVTPLDALLILNTLSQNGGAGSISEFSPPGRYWDVNGDGLITPLDALLILNFINHQGLQSATSESEPGQSPSPEGESVSQPLERSLLAGSASPLHRSIPPDAAPLIAAVRPATTSRAAMRFDEALEALDQQPDRREFPGDVETLHSDLQQLGQTLREMLTPADWETLTDWNSAIRSRALTPEVVARIELALERINRG